VLQLLLVEPVPSVHLPRGVAVPRLVHRAPVRALVVRAEHDLMAPRPQRERPVAGRGVGEVGHEAQGVRHRVRVPTALPQPGRLGRGEDGVDAARPAGRLDRPGQQPLCDAPHRGGVGEQVEE
jgi:hypothetical protein